MTLIRFKFSGLVLAALVCAGPFVGACTESKDLLATSKQNPAERKKVISTVDAGIEGLRLVGVTSTSADVSWDAPSADSGLSDGLVYEVRFTTAAAFDSIGDVEANGLISRAFGAADESSGAATVGDLLPARSYRIAVIVKDKNGLKKFYKPLEILTSGAVAPDGPLASNMNLTVSAQTKTGFTVSWTGASDDKTPSDQITYDVRTSIRSNLNTSAAFAAFGTSHCQVSGTTTSCAVTGLVADKPYVVNVMARDLDQNVTLYNPAVATPLASSIGSTVAPRLDAQSSQTKYVYDAVHGKRWAFMHDQGQIQAYVARANGDWLAVTTLAYDTPDFNVTSYGGFIFVAARSGFDIVVRRGQPSGETLTFGSEVLVFDGISTVDRYEKPALGLDTAGKLTIAAAHTLDATQPVAWLTRVRRTTADATTDLSQWSASADIGSRGMKIADLMVLDGGLGTPRLIVNQQVIQMYRFDGTTWNAEHTGGEAVWQNQPSAVNDGIISAVYADGEDLYVAGGFTYLDGTRLNHIAMRRNGKWYPLGRGLEGQVFYAMRKIPDGRLLVSGLFYTPENSQKYYPLATWDGQAWTYGFNNFEGLYVTGIETMGQDVYVSGSFNLVNSSILGIARWNGQSWQALGSGPNHTAGRMIKDSQGRLIVTGGFTTAGGIASNRVARWTGSAWEAMPGVLGTSVTAPSIMADGSVLIADNSNVYKFDGTSFQTVGGTSITTGGNITSVVEIGGKIHAFGTFTALGGVSLSGAGRWSGSAWEAIPGLSTASGIYSSSNSFTFAKTSNRVFVATGGNFGVPLLEFDGTAWSDLGSKTNYGRVVDTSISSNGQLASFSGQNVFMSGLATVAGVTVNQIAKWNGSSWSALGSGVTGSYITAHAVLPNGDLVACGDFTSIGGVTASRIARWNGSVWSALGTGLNNVCWGMKPYGTGVAVWGAFTTANGVATGGLAYFNGTTWTALGSGITAGTFSIVDVNGSNIYLMGSGLASGATNIDQFGVWNGSSWSSISPGSNFNVVTSGAVSSLVGFGSQMYVRGRFDQFLSWLMPVEDTFVWNGSTWSAIPNAETRGSSPDPGLMTSASTGDLLLMSRFADTRVLKRQNGGSPVEIGRFNSVSNIIPSLSSYSGTPYISSFYLGAMEMFPALYMSRYNTTPGTAVTQGNLIGMKAVTCNSKVYLINARFNRVDFFEYDGTTWSSPVALAYGSDIESPQIACESTNGKIVAAWWQDRALRFKVKSSGQWSDVQTTAESGYIAGFQFLPGEFGSEGIRYIGQYVNGAVTELRERLLTID